MFILRNPHKMPNTNDRQRRRCRLQTQDVNAENCSSITYKTHKRCRLAGMSCAVCGRRRRGGPHFISSLYLQQTHALQRHQPTRPNLQGAQRKPRSVHGGDRLFCSQRADNHRTEHTAKKTRQPPCRALSSLGPSQCFFVKEYFPVPSSGGNQCKNRHAPIWQFG